MWLLVNCFLKRNAARQIQKFKKIHFSWNERNEKNDIYLATYKQRKWITFSSNAYIIYCTKWRLLQKKTILYFKRKIDFSYSIKEKMFMQMTILISINGYHSRSDYKRWYWIILALIDNWLRDGVKRRVLRSIIPFHKHKRYISSTHTWISDVDEYWITCLRWTIIMESDVPNNK